MSLSPYVRKGKTSRAIGSYNSIVTSGDATIGGFVNNSVSAALTAHAGGTKAAALPLVSQHNYLGTVASAADSALLPPAIAGRWCTVFNGGAASAQLFGQGTDTIDGVATATGVPLANAKRAIFTCFVAGAWISAQLGVVSA